MKLSCLTYLIREILYKKTLINNSRHNYYNVQSRYEKFYRGTLLDILPARLKARNSKLAQILHC